MDMNIKLLDCMFHGYECPILGYYKICNEAVLTFTDITNKLICRIKFKNVLINENIEDRLAFDLNDAKDYVNSGHIELFSVDYGKRDDGKYFFKAELVQVPEEYFDYSKLGNRQIKFFDEIMEEKECPVMSFVSDEINVEIFEKIEK